MSEKQKGKIAATPAVKSKTKNSRQSKAFVPIATSTTRKAVPQSAVKDRMPPPRPKVNLNSTIIGDADTTAMQFDSGIRNFDAGNREIAYGRFLRAMLEDCLLEEKIEREEKEMDEQMAQLADRFQKTMDVLDKTNRRVKDISFAVEQKRLLDLKTTDCSQFYDATDKSNASEQLANLSKAEASCLDQLEAKNVDFGYNKETGHKQLLDAVNDALSGFEEIKKQSKLDMKKVEDLKVTENTLADLEKDKFDLEAVKEHFEKKYPKFGAKLIMQVSEKIDEFMNDQEAGVEVEDDDSDSD